MTMIDISKKAPDKPEKNFKNDFKKFCFYREKKAFALAFAVNNALSL